MIRIILVFMIVSSTYALGKTKSANGEVYEGKYPLVRFTYVNGKKSISTVTVSHSENFIESFSYNHKTRKLELYSSLKNGIMNSFIVTAGSRIKHSNPKYLNYLNLYNSKQKEVKLYEGKLKEYSSHLIPQLGDKYLFETISSKLNCETVGACIALSDVYKYTYDDKRYFDTIVKVCGFDHSFGCRAIFAYYYGSGSKKGRIEAEKICLSKDENYKVICKDFKNYSDFVNISSEKLIKSCKLKSVESCSVLSFRYRYTSDYIQSSVFHDLAVKYSITDQK